MGSHQKVLPSLWMLSDSNDPTRKIPQTHALLFGFYLVPEVVMLTSKICHHTIFLLHSAGQVDVCLSIRHWGEGNCMTRGAWGFCTLFNPGFHRELKNFENLRANGESLRLMLVPFMILPTTLFYGSLLKNSLNN